MKILKKTDLQQYRQTQQETQQLKASIEQLQNDNLAALDAVAQVYEELLAVQAKVEGGAASEPTS